MSQVSSVLDYQQKTESRPSYSFLKLMPLTQLPASPNITTSGGLSSSFQIPANSVFNWAESELQFTYTATACGIGANQYNVVYACGVPQIERIQVYTNSGVVLVDLNSANNFTNFTAPLLNSESDVKSMDSGSDARKTLSGIRVSNGLQTSVATGTIAVRPGLANWFADRNYSEQSYFVRATAAQNTAGPIIRYKIPLRMFRHTLLERDIDYPTTEIYNFQITWANVNKIHYSCAIATSIVENFTAPLSGHIDNLSLHMRREDNPDIKNKLLEQARSPQGLKILCDHAWLSKLNVSTASQSYVLRVNRGNGLRLKKIYCVPYFHTETGLTAYSHSIMKTVNSFGDKVLSYNTLLNSKQEQDGLIVCSVSKMDEWREHQLLLRESQIQSSDEFQFNFAHVSDYCDKSKPLWKQQRDDGNIIQGLDLKTDIEFMMQATTDGVDSINWYNYLICQREISISQNGVYIS